MDKHYPMDVSLKIGHMLGLRCGTLFGMGPIGKFFEVIHEIIKRPELWNVPNPDAHKVVEVLIAEGIYTGKRGRTSDQVHSVTRYLAMIAEMSKALKSCPISESHQVSP